MKFIQSIKTKTGPVTLNALDKGKYQLQGPNYKVTFKAHDDAEAIDLLIRHTTELPADIYSEAN